MRAHEVDERDGSWIHRETGEDVSSRLMLWNCQAGHEWEATIPDRIAGLADCPECAIAELRR